MGLLREFCRRFQLLLHKPRHWQLRPDTIDRRIFREVVIHNEYQLPARFDPRDVVLDVGAHIGFFALAALRRGAGAVHCWEANPDNFRLLQANLRPYANRVRTSELAVWRSDRPTAYLHFHNATPRNTGAGAVSTEADGLMVAARAFDDLIAGAVGDGRRVRLVKLDCEGSEWPILFTSRMLHVVDSLRGEYHWVDAVGPFAVAGYPQFTPAVLERFLSEQGFRVRTRPMTKDPRRPVLCRTRRSNGSGLADAAGRGARIGGPTHRLMRPASFLTAFLHRFYNPYSGVAVGRMPSPAPTNPPARRRRPVRPRKERLPCRSTWS